MSLERAPRQFASDPHRALAEAFRHVPILGYGLDLLARQRFARFLAVGALNTAVGYLLFVAALHLCPTTFSALVVSSLVAAVFGFASTGLYVFGSLDWRRAPRFLFVTASYFIWNAVGLPALEALGVPPAIGALLLLPGSVTLSWLINRYFVFSVSECASDRLGQA